MHRRTFLKAAAAAGLAVAAPVALSPREARAQAVQGGHEGPYFFFISCDGGWDPTSLIDPKGDVNGVNNYATDAIEQAGNIRYAPLEFQNEFFTAHSDKVMVVNGIDMSTNGHEQGRRYTWSGRLNEGHPSLGAIVAAKHGPALPMAYITNGGYDFTAGIVAPTRAENVDIIPRIAYSNRIRPDNDETYHSEYAMDRIRQAADERLDAQMQKVALPKVRDAMGVLHTARLGEAELKDVLSFLPEDMNGSGLENQAAVAIAAFRAGLGVSVNMRMGGFDTHGDHDNRHIPRLATVLRAVDFIWQQSEAAGIADKIVVAVGSDFGRTPGYNGGNGKDHWSVNSMLLMGTGIPGNTVVGATDEGHRPLTVNPDTLEVDENGVRIRPEHVHAGLRQIAGIDRDSFALQFPLDIEDELSLFG
jgi:uncharacterized protein (DUF1501 family)